MDLALIAKLFFSLFSFDPENMRWFNLRRIMVSGLLLPPFLCLFISNRIFLLLDHLFFFRFTRIKIDKAIFIIAAPRSATTYLFHKLASQHDRITAFKLWEIVFAPSIIQKYLLIGLVKTDGVFGRPLQKSILYFESRIFGSFRHIHLIGLRLPEEDEAILLWNFTTTCFHFFYPDTNHFDDYFLFDERIKPALQRKIMRYYYQCVQRHCFVFNRNGEKHFLSKNPALMSKVKSLHYFFPQATILNINRCPAKTIPSTIELHNRIYKFFTSRKTSLETSEKTKQILISWYKMAHQNLSVFYGQNSVEIDFDKLITCDEDTINTICDKINVDRALFLKASSNEKSEQGHVSENRYVAIGSIGLSEILEELPFLTKYCR